MVLYCATARVPQCMGSQISMENEQNPIHQHNKNTVYNNKLNSKLVGSVPSLMDYQWQCGCDHILGTFTAHTCTVLPRQEQQRPTGWYSAMRVLQYQMQQLQVYVMYWDCFAIIKSAVANFLALYLTCFAVTNSTVIGFYSILCLARGKSDYVAVAIF